MFDIREYGAKPDGVNINTKAIQAAIDQCSQSGGGCVLISGGTFVSGTLHIKSNVCLEIDVTARLLGSPDLNDYTTDTHWCRYGEGPSGYTLIDRCFLYAQDAENITICGGGIIDGNESFFPDEKLPDGSQRPRPMMLRTLRCKNVRLQGLRLYRAAGWTTNFIETNDIWCQNLDINSCIRNHSDGLDFDSCQNVFVSNCKLFTGDDGLCLQSSNTKIPTKNIQVTNCHFSSWCASIRIGLLSKGTITNVTINNCSFDDVWREGVKIECSQGGTISDIIVSNLVMRNVCRPVFLLLHNFKPLRGNKITPEIGKMERIVFTNIIATDTEDMKNPRIKPNKPIIGGTVYNGIKVDANENYPINQLTLKNIIYTTYGGVKKDDIPSEYPKVWDERYDCPEKRVSNYYPTWSRAAFMDIRNVKGLYLDNLDFRAINKDEREPYIIEGCEIIKGF